VSGAEVSLSVVCETRRYEGLQRRRIELHTNDKLNPNLQLELLVNVREHFSLEPNFLVFNHVTKGDQAKEELRLRQLSKEPLSLVSVDASAPWLVPTWERTLLDNTNEYRIRVKVAGTAPVGQHPEVLSLHIDQAQPTVIDVPVLVQVVGE